MKFIVSKLGKKAVSIICALAILLSVVSVAFGTFASGGSGAVYDTYTVNADTAPAIPVFSLTQVDLASAVEVKFAGDGSATAGKDITWTLLEGGKNILTLSGSTLTAYKSGVYKIKAESGSKSAILWVVVANQTDSVWKLYDIDFDKVALENNYAGLTFEPDGTTTSIAYTGAGTATVKNGSFKYTDANGSTSIVTADNIPNNLKFPAGWHSYTWSVANGPYQNDAEIQEIPHVMPYSHTLATATTYNNHRKEKVTSGIMPFDNPAATNVLNIQGETNRRWALGLAGCNSRGYFLLSNEITEAFSDYTITTNMDVALSSVLYGSGSYRVGVFGRMRMNATTGKPKTNEAYTINAFTAIAQSNPGIAGTAGGNRYIYTPADYTDANWYLKTEAKTVSHLMFSVCLMGQMHPYQSMPGGVVMSGYGVTYSHRGGNSIPGGVDRENGVPFTRWNYLINKGYNTNNFQNITPNLKLGVKYEGATATVFSPENTTQQIAFTNVPTDKGAVGVALGYIEGDYQYVNMHSFTIALNNNIAAENNGSEYPYYSEIDIYKVLSSNPALPMYSATFVEKGDFAVQGDDGSMYLGSDLTFTFKNLDKEGNELSTPVIGVKDDAAGRIYAYQKGAYKAVLTETATGKKVTEIWVAVKDNKGEDWVLYDIDFDAIAEANNYGSLTYTESGETKTVSVRHGSSQYNDVTIYDGSFSYNGTTFTKDNVPAELQFPKGWAAYTKAYIYGTEAAYVQIPHVMAYNHTAPDGVTTQTNRTVTTGLMPFDNPLTTNAFGYSIDTENFEVQSIVGRTANDNKGYFLLTNDITKAFTDYKITTDMHASAYNVGEGIFSTGRALGVIARLPVNADGIPTEEVFAGYSSDGYIRVDQNSAGKGINVKYNGVSSSIKATYFGVNLRADSALGNAVAQINMGGSVVVADMDTSKLENAHGQENIYTEASAAKAFTHWNYIKNLNFKESAQNYKDGVRFEMSVNYKGNTAVVSSAKDNAGQKFEFNNVYSTNGSVGIICPGIARSSGNGQWVSLHHFTLALSNSDAEVPPYTAIPMLSEDNNTLTVNVNEELALSEIAIVTETAIPTGAEATWSFASTNVTAAAGKLVATKAGYFNGTVTANGKTINIVIAVKGTDGELNTIVSNEENFVYITEGVEVDLAKYTLLANGKYFEADVAAATPEENSGIAISGGKLTASQTGYYTVTFATAEGDVAIVFAVKGNLDKFYKSDNAKFQMSADYIGAINRYGNGGWNDNILISVDRADSKAPYSQVLTVPDRIYNHYVQGDWVNIYSVGDAFVSGDYAKSTRALVIEKYIEKIGGYAFANFENLESLELSERLKEIGANAFAGNTKLFEVTLPATLTKIGANAFAGNTSLTDVWVMNPDAVTLGAGAFPAGVTVHVIAGSDAEASFVAAGYTTVALNPEKAAAFTKAHNDILTIEANRENTVDVGTWYQCSNKLWKEFKGLEFDRIALNNRDAGILHVPAEIEWTNEKGETATYALTQPNINAFCKTFERDRIYEIVFPAIDYQFQMGICEQMSNLKKVTLPTGLINFSQYDFYGTAIEEIVIPATVRNIDYNGYVFGDCTNLKSITFEDASRTAVFGGNNLNNTQVETLDLPVSVENVNRYVARKATNLKRINFYNKDAKLVKNTSYEADDSANYFTDVAAGFTIGCVKGGWMDAYAQKHGIPVVYLDDQLENKDNNPDNYVITKNGNVNSITDYFGIGGHLVIPSSGNTAEEKNVPVYSVTNTAFKYYLNKIRSVELSEGIISIGESAFANTPNLKSVKLPASLKTIGKEAFLNSGITGVLEIPKNVATISNSAFAGNSGITDVYFYNAATVIGSDSIPATAVIHGIKDSTAQAYAEKYEMKFVEIPAPSKETSADVTDNKNYRFTVTEDGVLTGYERIDDNKAYSLKVTIPAEVDGVKITAIGANIFDAGSESSSVYAVAIAEGITTINDNAFKGNLKLTHVSFPKTLEKIGESAFEGTMLIGDIEFGETFKDLGKNAFKGVNTLSSITILNKSCLIKSSAMPRGIKTFTLYGYYDSTAKNFAERNSIIFVSLDGEPVTDPGEDTTDPGEDTPKEPEEDNVQEPSDEVGDIGSDEPTTIITYVEEDLTMVIVLAVAMLMMMLLFGGGLILFIIIKGRQMQ